MMTHAELLKFQHSRSWWKNTVTAVLKEDVRMSVWNGHGMEPEFTDHICRAGSKVLIWMVSRFGDVGITDNFSNPTGYDARVAPEVLDNIEIKERE